jgi:hypothetical protein
MRFKVKVEATIAIVLLSALVFGCEGKKQVEKAQPTTETQPALELKEYKPSKEGEWFNIDYVVSFAENPSLVFKKVGDWLAVKRFAIDNMRNRANLFQPAGTVLSGVKSKDGVNPSIMYSCTYKQFSFLWGSAILGIQGNRANDSRIIFKVDGKDVAAAETWRREGTPTKLVGVNPATGEIKGKPIGFPATIPASSKTAGWLDEIGQGEPLRRILDAKTFEMAVLPKKDEIEGSVYVRWDFDRTLKEQQESGDLDRACKMLLGADYITVQTAKPKALKADKDGN